MSDGLNFPSGSPLDPSGNLTPQWRMFFLTLFTRSGGSAGNDTAALQAAIQKANANITDLQTEDAGGAPAPDLSMVYGLIYAIEAIAVQAMAAAARVHDERGEAGECSPVARQPDDRAEFGDASAYGDLLSRFRSLEGHVHGPAGERALSMQDIDAQLAAGAFMPTDTAHLTNGAGFVTSQAGRILGVRTLANGVYTPTAGTNYVLVRFQAPGGAGGGTPATGSGQYAAASCGGAGAFVEAWFPVSALTGQTVNLGTPGAGVSAAAGNAGSSATFGSAITCPGGSGGFLANLLTAAGVTFGPPATAAPTVTGGTVLMSVPGIGGGAGVVFAPGVLQGILQGGSSPVGQGSQPKWSGGANVGQGYGWGGGGANAPASTAAQAGATGGNGWCEVWEFT